jgi:hypothetical protein
MGQPTQDLDKLEEKLLDRRRQIVESLTQAKVLDPTLLQEFVDKNNTIEIVRRAREDEVYRTQMGE